MSELVRFVAIAIGALVCGLSFRELLTAAAAGWWADVAVLMAFVVLGILLIVEAIASSPAFHATMAHEELKRDRGL